MKALSDTFFTSLEFTHGAIFVNPNSIIIHAASAAGCVGGVLYMNERNVIEIPIVALLISIHSSSTTTTTVRTSVCQRRRRRFSPLLLLSPQSAHHHHISHPMCIAFHYGTILQGLALSRHVDDRRDHATVGGDVGQ